MRHRPQFAGFCAAILMAGLLISSAVASPTSDDLSAARWQTTPIADVVYEPITAENIIDVQVLSIIQVPSGLTDVAWSPSAASMVAAGTDGTTRVYRTLELDEEPMVYSSHTQGVFGARIGPDNRLMATVSADGFIIVNNLATNNLLHVIDYGAWLWTIDFHPEGDIFATGATDGRIILWELESGDAISSFEAEHDDAVTKLDFNPEGTRLASASLDGTARVWDVFGSEELLMLEGHDGGLSTVAYSPDGTLIATASGDMTVRVWNAETGEALHVLTGHTSGISGISFNGNSTLLASAGQDVGIHIWDVEAGELLTVLEEHGAWVRSVAFNTDGTMLASGDFGGSLRIWGIPD